MFKYIIFIHEFNAKNYLCDNNVVTKAINKKCFLEVEGEI